MAARGGQMKYFNDIMGVYRKHDKGASFSAKMNAQKSGNSDFALPSKYAMEMIDNLNRYFNYKYNKELKLQSAYWCYLYVKEYLKIGDLKMARRYAGKILKQIFPLSRRKNSWMTKNNFLRLLLIFLPISIQKIIKKIYDYAKK